MKACFSVFCLAFAFSLFTQMSSAQYLIKSDDRVRTPIKVGMDRIGTLNPKSTGQIESSRLTVGCETIDRDLVVWDNYKDYLPPLGVKKIRLQAGWAKCERVPGEYNWQWLDEIINFAVANDMKPWVQASYGNPVYQGGGGTGLLNSLMTSEEGYTAWDRWVEALVSRYKDRVTEWEVWNEPDHPMQEISPETAAELNIRTAEIIKRIQPEAKIAGLAFASNSDQEYLERFLKVLADRNKLNLFHWISYHSYTLRPEDAYSENRVLGLRSVIKKYSDHILLRQGENGAPSTYIPGFALSEYYWTEYTQAKYNLRRMLGDLGNNIETSVFTIIDIYYKPVLNTKGLIQSDITRAAIRPKVAYYAVQNLAAVFDDDMILDPDFSYSLQDTVSVSAYGYNHKPSGIPMATLWLDDKVPSNSFETKDVTVTFDNCRFNEPVWVDLMTGAIHQVIPSHYAQIGNKCRFTIPLYDSPILVTEKKFFTAALSSTSMPETGYIPVGQVKPRTTHEIESSNWILGCETLDRDMTDYEQYKEYLAPLGIKMLRLQAGWAKTEKEKGVYNWEWLDRIIYDAVERGCIPWLQTSYGNLIYSDGGGTNLSAGIPTSAEALSAWDRWVENMVTRYKDKVNDWEVWNEPNFGDNTINSPEDVAALNIRTADIIKRIQPEAKISGLSMGHIDLDYADRFFRYIHERGKMNLFDNMTYHDYVYNPDSNYGHVYELRRVLDRYAPEVKLRQGENGAPSMPGYGRGALGDWNWSELSQAKWNTRRMLGNLGHDIECSILGIIDMNYNASGPITRLNVKGILQSDSTQKVIRPKLAYFAMQNIAAIFDDSLQPIKKLNKTFNVNAPANKGEVRYNINTDRSFAVYGFEKKATGKQVYTVWMDESIPTNANQIKNIQFTLIGAEIDQPCYVDILSGAVFEIPAEKWKREGQKLIIKDLPVYDAPILVADKSILSHTSDK